MYTCGCSRLDFGHARMAPEPCFMKLSGRYTQVLTICVFGVVGLWVIFSSISLFFFWFCFVYPYVLIRAALTKYCQLGGLMFVSHSLGNWKVQDHGAGCWCLVRAHLLVYIGTPPCCVLKGWREIGGLLRQ